MPLAPEHSTAITNYSKELGVDPDLALAVAGQESGNLGEKAVSPKGARGVMQIMPETSKVLKPKYGPDRRRQGVGYLHDLSGGFGDLGPDERDNFTLASYNAGPGKVAQARAAARQAGLDDKTFANVAQFLPKETQNYIPGVMSRRGKGTSVVPGPGVTSVEHDDSDIMAMANEATPAPSDDSDIMSMANETPAKSRSLGEQARDYVPGLQGLHDLAKFAGHFSGVRPMSEEEWADMAKRGEEQRAHPIATGLGAAADIAGVAVPGLRPLTAAGVTRGMTAENLTGSQTAGHIAAMTPGAGSLVSDIAKGGKALIKGGESAVNMVRKGLSGERTAAEVGRELQAPGGGARGAITQSSEEASRLYGKAGETAKAAGAVVPATDTQIARSAKSVIKDTKAAGGSLSGDARRVVQNILKMGRGKAPQLQAPEGANLPSGARDIVAGLFEKIHGKKTPAIDMPVDQLIEQQSHLRRVINMMGPNDPARRSLINLSTAIDDAMGRASTGTKVGEELGQARGYYRDVTIPTKKTMGRVARAEEPESATRLLTQSKKPSRFQRLEVQQLGPKGEEFGKVVEGVRSSSFNDMIQGATKNGKLDFGALSDSLHKAESSGQLEQIANTAARKNMIKAVKKVARAQAVASKAPLAGGGVGVTGSWPGIAAGYTLGRVINAGFSSETASRALLRMATAKQGSSGWKIARNAFLKAAKSAAPAVQETISQATKEQ